MSAPALASDNAQRAQGSRGLKGLFALLVILVLGVGLRCIHLTDPYIADFHAWRQADTAAFTHGYLIETFNPFSPRVDRQPCSVPDAPFGLVEAELPIAAWMASVPLKLLGVDFPPPWYLRLVSIAFYVAAAIYMWRLALLLGARRAEANLAVFAFSSFPLSVFFTRTPQPDGPALLFTLAFLFHLERWLQRTLRDSAPDAALSNIPVATSSRRQRNADLALCCVMGGCMLLIKVSNAFIGAPAAYLVLSALGLRRALTSRGVWLIGCAVLGVGAAWYLHAHSFPWTFGIWGDRAASKFATWDQISSASVWATLSLRMVSPIAGWAALLLAGIALGAGLEERRVRLCVVWLLAFGAFVLLALQGHETHIYYQLPCVLPLALLVGRGASRLWAGPGCASQPDASSYLPTATVEAAPSRPSRAPWAARGALLGLLALHAVNLRHVMFSSETRGERRGFYHPDIDGLDGAKLLRGSLPPRSRFVSADRNPVLFYNSRHQGYFADNTGVASLLRCADGRAEHILVPRRYASSEHKYRKQIRRVAESEYFLLWQVQRPAPP